MSEKILDIKEERLSFFTPAGEVKMEAGICRVVVTIRVPMQLVSRCL